MGESRPLTHMESLVSGYLDLRSDEFEITQGPVKRGWGLCLRTGASDYGMGDIRHSGMDGSTQFESM